MKYLALCLLLACSSTPAPAPAQPAPNVPDPAPPATTGPAMGEKCGADDACATGLTCVSYYGIAGKSGPEFKSCEIKCKADSDCPAAHRCATIADGPGQVCRPAAPKS